MMSIANQLHYNFMADPALEQTDFNSETGKVDQIWKHLATTVTIDKSSLLLKPILSFRSYSFIF